MNILNWPDTLPVPTRTMAPALCLALLASATMPQARADLIDSPFLPLDDEQYFTRNASFGGSSDCRTDGNYTAATTAYTQSGTCTDTGLRVDNELVALGVSLQASLDAEIDNFGQVIGGSFSLFGIVDDLGIIESTLLASGTLIDAHYEANGDNFIGAGGVQTLIELDFLDAALGDLGDLLLWNSFANVSSWFGDLEWQVDAGGGHDYANFTGSEYLFYDRALISEPGTFALGCLGLMLVWMTRRQRLAGTSPRGIEGVVRG